MFLLHLRFEEVEKAIHLLIADTATRIYQFLLEG
jgi:hypothetical protein